MLALETEKLVIIGPGLLGGSFGLAMRRCGFPGKIVGVARQADTIDAAIRVGCINEGTTDLKAAVQDAGLVMIATPVSTLSTIVQEVAMHCGDAIVSDVGSTKAQIVQAAAQAVENGSRMRFVGSHPMAGKAEQGPEAAEADLFEGRPCILTRTDRDDENAVRTIKQMWQAIGMHVREMSPQEHDLKAAVVSHLPHLAAVLLVQTTKQLGGWDIASTGFETTTRLAASNPPMRTDIIRANRDAILDSLQTFRSQIEKLIQCIEQDDDQELLALLEQTRDVRKQWADSRDD